MCVHTLYYALVIQIARNVTHRHNYTGTPVHILLPSLVPRPSASCARIAYVTFEPLSDSWQKAWYHSYVIYKRLSTAIWTRFHVKWLCARSSRTNGRFPSDLLLAFTLPWWTTGGVQVWNSLLYGCSSLGNYNSLPLQ